MNLANFFSDWTVTEWNIIFWLLRNKLMKATIHWVQEFRRISWTPSLIGISNSDKFCTDIEAERQRAGIRKHSLEELDSLSKAVYPDNLKRKKEWITWSRALRKYLSTIIGQEGGILRYVIRESAAPDYTIELQLNYNFEKLLINCVNLTGLTYKKDTRKLHQLIHGFMQCETVETWINPKEREQDVQLDHPSLLDHYRSEGKEAVRIK